MCVVIRYFGGTKLGVGGLIKAYTNSCLEALNLAPVVQYESLTTYLITISYSNYDKLEYFLKKNDVTVIDKQFNDKVCLSVSVNEEKYKLLEDNFYNYCVIKKIT